MAYRIIKRPDYRYPVEVAVLGENGSAATYKFTAIFLRLSQQEIDKTKDESVTDEGLVRKVLAGWDGVQDDQGVELPFNPENLTLLLADHGLRFAIASAWYASLEKELRKN